MTERTVETQPGKFMRYTAVGKTPDWTGIDKQKLIEYLSRRYGLSEADAGSIFITAIGWHCDNEKK